MFDARTLLETQVGRQLALTWQQVVDVGQLPCRWWWALACPLQGG
jgi:hypothetical protein